MVDLALAVDIGGTKLAVGLVSADGCLVTRAQRPTRRTPETGGPGDGAGDGGERLWRDVEELVQEIVEAVPAGDRLVVCGAGCGGPMSPGGEEVSPLNITVWRSFPLRARLAGATGLPTFVDNDAKALALGEGWIGAAAGAANYIAMVVSTGIGGGIVLDGRLLGGQQGNAGHVGHIVVEPDGRPCPCGSHGCLEAEASGTALAKMTGAPVHLAPPELVERTGVMVGRAVGSVVNLLDLPLAVVSGSVALGFGEPFFRAAQTELEARCGLEFTHGARVVPGGLGDEGPLVGAGRVGLAGLVRLESGDGA
ncbi:MAG TPA: ROK family protein [Acidimicrobiales bacterium]